MICVDFAGWCGSVYYGGVDVVSGSLVCRMFVVIHEFFGGLDVLALLVEMT